MKKDDKIIIIILLSIFAMFLASLLNSLHNDKEKEKQMKIDLQKMIKDTPEPIKSDTIIYIS